MRNLYILLLLVLLCSLSRVPPLHAQDLRFEHLTTAEGLPDNHVNAILQDRLGFLWFGLSVGLVKYDGYTFTLYRPEADDPTSISGIGINALREDAAGNLWIGTDDGLNRLDRATGRFTRYLHDPNDPTSLPDNVVLAIATSAATPDLLWIGTMSGLVRFNPASGAFSLVPADLDGLPDRLSPRTLYEAPSEPGILWMGSGLVITPETLFPGLIRFDTATESFTSYRYDTNAADNSFTGGAAVSILGDREERLWLVGDGLRRFDRQTGLFETFMPNPANPSDPINDLFDLHQDAGGTLWVGGQAGQIGQFDTDTKTFTWHQHDPNDPSSLGSNTWIGVFHSDREGVLWIGGRGGGLNKLDQSAAPFTVHVHDPEKTQSIGAGNIRAILEDRSGTLWVGSSQNGLDRWDRPNGTMIHYQHDPANPQSLSAGEVVALYEDADDELWVGTCSGGLSRFERTTGTFTHFEHDPANAQSLSNNCVNAILEDQAGRFWVGTWGGGLNRFDEATGIFTRYQHNPADPQSLPGDFLLAHLEDRDGGLWFGLDGSFSSIPLHGGTLVKFDPESGHFTSYLASHLRVMALHEDQAGQLWVGTAGDGLFRFDRETGQHKNYTIRDGLAHNIVWANLEDDVGNLWISTDNGLSRFDARMETFQNYDTQDGLHSHIFSERAAFKSTSGELFFGGQGGLTTFFPARIRGNTNPPPVVLTEFRVAGVPVASGEEALLKTHINVAEEITLAHHQKDIALSFAALSYKRVEKNRYAFYLEGYEDTWGTPSPERTATYTNLDPGTYTFRVKASNRDGVWNEEGASLRITIEPPWWQTTWAYLLYGLIFIGGVFAVDRLQRRRVLAKERERTREREREQAHAIEKAYHELRETKNRLVQQEKMASLGELTAGIAHEIKNPLNFINNFAEIVGEMVEELGEELDTRQQDIPDDVTHNFKEILADLRVNSANIEKHGKRADSIVHAMMQHASGGSGEREPTELNHLVSEHIALAYHSKWAQVPDLQAEIKQELDDRVGSIEMVPQEIGRVLLNLLGNAFDAVHEKMDREAERHPDKSGQAPGAEREYIPTVTVSTRRVDNGVEIRVSDNGPGIPKELEEKIFEPFFTTKPTGSGTGLGLSLSYDIVTQGHGGTLNVESEEGQGATFIIALPTARLMPESTTSTNTT